MFEAIQGSAPRMVREGRAKYAAPARMIRAAAMLVSHIGYPERARNLEMALDVCGNYEKKLVVTGRDSGVTGAEYANYIMETMQDPKLRERWESYVQG
jgi:isocitrate/isopropylmalate dehydrogenase